MDRGGPPETAERIYELHCLGCHGKTGEGTYGSNIQGLKRPIEDIVKVIAEGAGRMPAFRGHLTDEQEDDEAAAAPERSAADTSTRFKLSAADSEADWQDTRELESLPKPYGRSERDNPYELWTALKAGCKLERGELKPVAAFAQLSPEDQKQWTLDNFNAVSESQLSP